MNDQATKIDTQEEERMTGRAKDWLNGDQWRKKKQFEKTRQEIEQIS